jgi:hypothetical protein
MSCCAATWVGPDRAHCCRRTRGCGQVFDDAALYDIHRRAGTCLDPRTLGLLQTATGSGYEPLTTLAGTSDHRWRRHSRSTLGSCGEDGRRSGERGEVDVPHPTSTTGRTNHSSSSRDP